MTDFQDETNTPSVPIIKRNFKDSIIYYLYWRPGIFLLEFILSLVLIGIGSAGKINDVILLIGFILFGWSFLHRFLRPFVKGIFSAANHNQLGSSFLDDGKIDDAISEFTTAISLAPRWPVPYNYRAVPYTVKKEFKKALADANMAIELDKHYPKAHYMLGMIYMEMGSYQEALKRFKDALQIIDMLTKSKPKTLIEYTKFKEEIAWRIPPIELIKKDMQECEEKKKGNIPS